jgi:hypothetical protein
MSIESNVPMVGSNCSRASVPILELVGVVVVGMVLLVYVIEPAKAVGAATSRAKATTARVMSDELRKVFMIRPLPGQTA